MTNYLIQKVKLLSGYFFNGETCFKDCTIRIPPKPARLHFYEGSRETHKRLSRPSRERGTCAGLGTASVWLPRPSCPILFSPNANTEPVSGRKEQYHKRENSTEGSEPDLKPKAPK